MLQKFTLSPILHVFRLYSLTNKRFVGYRLGLASVEPNRKLYFAVPIDVYQRFFQYEFTQTAVQQYQVLLIVYDPTNEVIVQWTN